MKRLVILGGGGHGRVAAEVAELSGYHDIAFLDPRGPSAPLKGPWPIIGVEDDATLEALRVSSVFFVATGDNGLRTKLTHTLKAKKLTIATLIHEKTVVSRHAMLGAGALVCAGAVIGPFAVIGEGCIVNTCASVDHDCELGRMVHVAPGARLAADVAVGTAAFIGTGAVILPGRRIGAEAVIGGGATVVDDVNDGATVVGTPAQARV